MNITVRKYLEDDIGVMNEIWNQIVKQGNAFPQTELLDECTGKTFFVSQTY